MARYIRSEIKDAELFTADLKLENLIRLDAGSGVILLDWNQRAGRFMVARAGDLVEVQTIDGKAYGVNVIEEAALIANGFQAQP